MFAGYLDETTIISDQPVLVVDGKSVVNSFARIDEATDFVARIRSDTAVILRHNGLNWDICPRTHAPAAVN